MLISMLFFFFSYDNSNPDRTKTKSSFLLLLFFSFFLVVKLVIIFVLLQIVLFNEKNVTLGVCMVVTLEVQAKIRAGVGWCSFGSAQ